MSHQFLEGRVEFEMAHLRSFATAARAPDRTLRGIARHFKPYLVALACVALSTLLALLVEPFSSLEDEGMIYLLGDIVAALRFDTRVSIFTAIGSVVACDFLFVQPRMTFAWTDTRKALTFVAMIVVAVVVSGLSARLRQQEKVARQAAEATRALYELNVVLSSSDEPRQLAQLTRRRLEMLTGGKVVISLDDDAQPSQSTAPAPSLWLPVPGQKRPLGRIGLEVHPIPDPNSQEGLLLSAFARELGAAIERARLSSAAKRAELEAEAERLRSSLLSVVSHDLKTPLAGIVASGSMLLESENAVAAPVARRLIGTLVHECERLARLLQNLLSMSRLESPRLLLRRTPEAVEDLVASALERLRSVLAEREVTVDVPADLPCVLVEPALIEQLLLNLLENAARHTPPQSRIAVSARAQGDMITLGVSDDGPGIAPREREQVFQEFFRGARARSADGGVGLGLSICRAIVRAHGGSIAIGEGHGGGTCVEFSMPTAAPLASHRLEELV